MQMQLDSEPRWSTTVYWSRPWSACQQCHWVHGIWRLENHLLGVQEFCYQYAHKLLIISEFSRWLCYNRWLQSWFQQRLFILLQYAVTKTHYPQLYRPTTNLDSNPIPWAPAGILASVYLLPFLSLPSLSLHFSSPFPPALCTLPFLICCQANLFNTARGSVGVLSLSWVRGGSSPDRNSNLGIFWAIKRLLCLCERKCCKWSESSLVHFPGRASAPSCPCLLAPMTLNLILVFGDGPLG